MDNMVRDAAASPAKAMVDGTSIEQQPLHDIIEADKHEGAKAAGKNPARALVRMKIVPSGAV